MIEGQRLQYGILACLVGLLWASPLGAGTRKQPVRHDKRTMSEPRLVHKVAPVYPEDAKKEGVQGTVILDAVISKDGSVSETRLQEDADPRLVEAARTAVEQWRYEPVRDERGEPLEVLFTVTIRFALSDS